MDYEKCLSIHFLQVSENHVVTYASKEIEAF